MQQAKEQHGEYLLKFLGDGQPAGSVSPDVLRSEELFNLAQSHGVLPLLVQKLGSDAPDNFRQRSRELTVRSLEYMSELNRLAALFELEGIEIVFIKGIALAHSIYHPPQLRVINDIDALVCKKDFAGAETILIQNGYVQTAKRTVQQKASELRFMDAAEYYNPKKELIVDLHWNLLKNFYSVNFSLPRMFEDTITIQRDGWGFKTLHPEDHLLFLCAHGGKHTWNELKWILDISHVLLAHPEVDLTASYEKAKTIGCGRMLLLGLALAQSIAGVQYSSDIETQISQDGAIRSMLPQIQSMIVRDEELDVPQTIVADLKMRERWRDRLRYVLLRTFAPNAEDWRCMTLPDFAYPIYYIIRPFRLLWRYVFS